MDPSVTDMCSLPPRERAALTQLSPVGDGPTVQTQSERPDEHPSNYTISHSRTRQGRSIPPLALTAASFRQMHV